MAQITERGFVEHELGVHINQRAEDYLADLGLGYGAVKDLYLSPTEWWDASPYNPLRDDSKDDERKLAFARGTALHTHVLDGPKVYDKVYGFMPTAKTHPDAADTVAQLQEVCRWLGIDPKGNKPELIHRVIAAKVPVPILWQLQDEFRLSGKLVVTPRDDMRIKILYAMMMRSAEELLLPHGEHLTLRDALKNALTEVSVYWVDEYGIRQRARFDILKPNFSGDLKSITQWKKSNFKRALLAEIILRGYMIQAAHYHHGRFALRQAVDEGRVFGKATKTQLRILDRVAEAEEWAWINIFAKMDGAAQVRGIVTKPDTSAQFKKAMAQREEGLANFIYYRDLHGGFDRPWFDPEVVWQPEETDWPLFSILGDN